MRSCLALAQLAIIAGAVVWTLVRLLPLRRRGEAYGLSDALGAGAVGGMLGLAAAAGLCALRAGLTQPVAAWLGAWVQRFVPLGGLALIEGAVVGAALGFALAWADKRAHHARPGGDRHGA